jgi:hypothetical protein
MSIDRLLAVTVPETTGHRSRAARRWYFSHDRGWLCHQHWRSRRRNEQHRLQDIAALYFSVNEAYRNNPKTAFLNDSTRTYLASIVTKQGPPLVNGQRGEAFIYENPVRISPGTDNIGPSNHPVLFGDGSS